LLGPVKATVTIIHAGTQHNVIPDSCQFTIDVRSNECYTNQELFDEIAPYLKGTAVARSFRLNSSGIDPEHPIVKKAIGLGLKPFGSPTLSNQALLPFPSVKIGPGDSARSHTADEYIKIAEIEHAIKLYIQLLQA
jgi:acetylornithine deacetylase